jgi:hypothetical protein
VRAPGSETWKRANEAAPARTVCLTMAPATAQGGRSRRQVTVDRLFAWVLTLLQLTGQTTGGQGQAPSASWTALLGLVLAVGPGIPPYAA